MDKHESFPEAQPTEQELKHSKRVTELFSIENDLLAVCHCMTNLDRGSKTFKTLLAFKEFTNHPNRLEFTLEVLLSIVESCCTNAVRLFQQNEKLPKDIEKALKKIPQSHTDFMYKTSFLTIVVRKLFSKSELQLLKQHFEAQDNFNNFFASTNSPSPN